MFCKKIIKILLEEQTKRNYLYLRVTKKKNSNSSLSNEFWHKCKQTNKFGLRAKSLMCIICKTKISKTTKKYFIIFYEQKLFVWEYFLVILGTSSNFFVIYFFLFIFFIHFFLFSLFQAVFKLYSSLEFSFFIIFIKILKLCIAAIHID